MSEVLKSYRRWHWPMPFLCCVLLALHVGAVLVQFPLRLGLDGQPLASGDCGITLGKAWDASRGAEAGGAIGYSPSYMAGYPSGSWNSVGHRGYELGATHLPFGSAPARYYWTVVGMTCLIPLLLGSAARVCGYPRSTALTCAAFGAAVVQLCDPVAFFWSFGNAAFPFASALAVLAVALALPGGKRVAYPRAALAGAVAGLAIWAHTISALPLLCGGLAAAVVGYRSAISISRLAGLIATAIIVAGAIVLPGHIHLLASLGERTPMAVAPLPSGIKHLIFDVFSDRAYRHPLDRRPLFHVLLAFATWQAWSEGRARRGRAEGLWLAGILTLALGYASGHAPLLKQLQPYRFVVSGDLFLAIPACLGILRFADRVRAAPRSSRVATVVLGAAFAPSLIGYGFDIPARERAAPLSPDAMACVEWVRAQPAGGRVLCEAGDLGSLLPHLADREVIGGGVSGQAVVAQGWSHVGEGRAFGRSLDGATPEGFLRMCRLFDIRILIVDTDRLEQLILKLPGDAHRVTAFGPLRVYRLDPRPAPEIWPGCYTGKVSATHNRIRIDDPPAGPFTIDYHYAKGFRTDPGVAAEPASIDGAGAPFIRITNGGSNSSIELKWGD